MHPDFKIGFDSPFSCLNPEQEKRVLSEFSFQTHAKNTLLFIQEISRIEAVLVVTKGRARYFIERNKSILSQGFLGPGDIFGGISALFNNQIAVYSLVVEEELQVMRLDTALFLDLCETAPSFKDVFALHMGRCMGNSAFADCISRRIQDRELNLPFFNQPVSAIFRPNIVTCDHDLPIKEAVQKMDRQGSSAILIRSADKEVQAIVTDADLKSKLIAKDMDLKAPISHIASSPLSCISSQSQVFEAFLTMIKEDRRHLVVLGNSGSISGILTEKDLISAQTKATFLLIKSVKSARKMDDLANIHHRLEKMLLDPIGNGAGTDYITRLITTFSDAIIDKTIEFSIEEAGEPPCKFVFLTMGSEGREEQTLISDQDNAIIFEDIQDKAEADQAKAYFDNLARGICRRLDLAGYQFCEGNNMAQNPDWCRPLSGWKALFQKWIRSASPEDLLHSSIFFDFRGTWGELSLAQELKSYLLEAISKWSGFLRNMTENTLHFKPPLGLFGKFVVETKGKYKDALDIKYAILPIIDFARIYALQNGITQTNTLARLFRLYTRHALTSREYTDLTQSYNFLMKLRFRRQITSIMDENGSPDNYIYPGHLSYLDQMMLKEVLRLVEKFQQKLNIEFTGVV